MDLIQTPNEVACVGEHCCRVHDIVIVPRHGAGRPKSAATCKKKRGEGGVLLTGGMPRSSLAATRTLNMYIREAIASCGLHIAWKLRI